jgi:hypothetical protein
MMVLLVSTTGLTIYKLHCSCLQHEYISVLVEPENCHSGAESYCCSDAGQCTHANSHHDNQAGAGCDTQEAFFVKLSAHFLTGSASVTVSPVQFEIFNVLFPETVKLQNPESEKIPVTALNSPPPLVIPGQKMVTLFHQFKFGTYPLFA